MSTSSGRSQNLFIDHSQESSQQFADGGWGNSHKLADEMSSFVRAMSDQIKEMDARILAMDRKLNSISIEIANTKVDDQGKASTMENGLRDIDGRIRSIEQVAKKIRSEVEGRDYKETLNTIQRSLKETQSNLLRALAESITEGKEYSVIKEFS